MADRLERPRDARLVAALTLLRDDLALVVDELLGGELDQADRDHLAHTFRALADELSRVVEVPDAEQLRPAGASPERRLPFSASGP